MTGVIEKMILTLFELLLKILASRLYSLYIKIVEFWRKIKEQEDDRVGRTYKTTNLADKMFEMSKVR